MASSSKIARVSLRLRGTLPAVGSWEAAVIRIPAIRTRSAQNRRSCESFPERQVDEILHTRHLVEDQRSRNPVDIVGSHGSSGIWPDGCLSMLAAVSVAEPHPMDECARVLRVTCHFACVSFEKERKNDCSTTAQK